MYKVIRLWDDNDETTILKDDCRTYREAKETVAIDIARVDPEARKHIKHEIEEFLDQKDVDNLLKRAGEE